MGIVIGLATAELALRAVGISYPKFYQADQERGYSQRPGIEGWYHLEGKAYIKINSDGLRDREHAKVKPPNTLRIAVLGDSYAEALQVPLAETFWSVMEARLRECSGLGRQQVEVINFGVSGYGTAQELITLRERVWQYSPDIVVLAFLPANDVTDNSRALRANSGKDVPYFVIRDGHLTLDASFRDSSAFRFRESRVYRLGTWLRDHSRVLQALHLAHFAYSTRQVSKHAPKSPDASGSTTTGPGDPEPGLEDMMYQEPAHPLLHEAWQVTERLLVAMQHEVQSKGAEFLVVTLSTGNQVYPDAAARRTYIQRLGQPNYFYPDLRIRVLGDREGFAVLNLAPELQKYADQHHVFLHGFGRQPGTGHWNLLGHRVAGEMIARHVCEGRVGQRSTSALLFNSKELTLITPWGWFLYGPRKDIP